MSGDESAEPGDNMQGTCSRYSSSSEMLGDRFSDCWFLCYAKDLLPRHRTCLVDVIDGKGGLEENQWIVQSVCMSGSSMKVQSIIAAKMQSGRVWLVRRD